MQCVHKRTKHPHDILAMQVLACIIIILIITSLSLMVIGKGKFSLYSIKQNDIIETKHWEG